MTERSAAVRLRAEVDQYVRDMDRAGTATAGVGKAGERAAEQLVRAQKRQVDSAMSVRIAEERLSETRAKANARASEILAAEQSVARAKDASAEASRSLTRAQDAQSKSARESSTALGRLSASARDNREAWQQASVPLLAAGAGVTAMGVAALRTGVQYNTLQQTSRAALTTLLGGAEAANAQMDKLDEFARNSPFAKQTFITAQQQLLGFGMEASKVLPTLDAIQNAVAAFGGSNQQISEIAFVLAQVQAAGKITATDLMQLGQRGVDAATLIGSQMGMTGAEIRESITAGTLDADTALAALTAGMQQRFGGAAANVKNTFVGSLDRVKAAWRDLSSEIAEPFVGKQGGGIFTGLLNESADLLRSVEDLPVPLKATAVGLTALVGAGSLAAGGFLLLAPRIVETRESLAELRTDMPRTSAVMSKLGTAAKVTAAGLAALGAAQAVAAAVRDNDAASVEKYTSALIDLGDAAGGKQLEALARSQSGLLDESLGGIAATLLEVKSNSAGLGKIGNDIASLVGMEDQRGANSLRAIDDALAGMVQSGNLDQASAGFDYLRKRGELVGVSTDELTNMLPAYADALKGVENEQRLAGDSAGKMGGEVKKSAEEIAAAEEAMQKAKKASEDLLMGFLDVDSQLSKKRGVQDWLKDLENQVRAQQKFSENMAKLMLRGASEDVLAYIQEQGPQAAELLDQLANGAESSIRRANNAFAAGGEQARSFAEIVNDLPPTVVTELKTRGTDVSVTELARLAETYGLLPTEVETLMSAMDYATPEIKAVLALMADADRAEARPKVTADVAQARAAINSIMWSLNSLPLFRQITVNTKSTRSGDDAGNAARAPGAARGWRVPDGYAGGGRVPGTPPTDPRRDNVLAMTQRGRPLMVRSREWIINQKQSERNDAWLAAVNAGLNLDDVFGSVRTQMLQGYASGGQVDAADRLETLRMRIRVRDLERSLREMEEYGEPDKKTKKRKTRLRLRGMDRLEARYELIEARREYSDTVRANRAARRAGMSPSRYNRYREDRAEQRRELLQDRRQASSSFLDNASIEGLSTPAQVEQALNRSLTDMATLTSLLIELKKRGAAPWLLQQLQAAGPSKAAIRLARHYLADRTALSRVNAQARQLQQVSTIYGQVTTDPKWEAAGAWSGSLTRGQQQTLTRIEQNLTVQLDDTSLSREVARLVQHYFDAGQQTMGVLGG